MTQLAGSEVCDFETGHLAFTFWRLAWPAGKVYSGRKNVDKLSMGGSWAVDGWSISSQLNFTAEAPEGTEPNARYRLISFLGSSSNQGQELRHIHLQSLLLDFGRVA